MAEIDLSQLRALRRRAATLNAGVSADLSAFRDDATRTYRQLPGDVVTEKNIRVTTTCTALMTLALNGQILAGTEAEEVFDQVFRADWRSGGLDDENAFTTILVLRTAGVLARHGVLTVEKLGSLKRTKNGRSIRDLVLRLAKSLPQSLSVQEYPPAAPLGYWFMNAADELQIELPCRALSELVRWTTTQFARQVSMVTAQYDTMMDPVAMGMAACLAIRLERSLSGFRGNGAEDLSALLPSSTEINHSLTMLFSRQQPSGIWAKYFPLFHYTGGNNYCFSFELLEAILHEHGANMLNVPHVFNGLERAVAWCETNRYEFQSEDVTYSGWNSGGHLKQLAARKPESWATGVIHMFLLRLVNALSVMIQRRVLEKYSAIHPEQYRGTHWKDLVRTGVTIMHENSTVQDVLEAEVLRKIMRGQREAGAGSIELDHRRSALLFGPPGTSKTSLVRAFSHEIKWPYIEITPSHFLTNGLERIYAQADEVFDDLLDLTGVVILFDEMDALVRRRRGEGGDQGIPLDVTQQFLTTSMLPKLARLHDAKGTVFFMATNHQKGFDPAIKRPGRFDLLLCMGPPSWEFKTERMKAFLPKWLEDKAEEIASRLREWAKEDNEAVTALDLFTFGEMQVLLEQLCKAHGNDAAQFLDWMDESGSGERFRSEVRRWHKDWITLRDNREDDLYEEYRRDVEESRLQ